MNGRIHRPDSIKQTLMLPRIGKVKIGMVNAKGYPQSVDYFVPTGKYASLFTKAYGDKPQTIHIVFPSDEAKDVCCEYYEYRDSAGKLVATGDGLTFSVWNGEVYQEFRAENYPDIMDKVAAKWQGGKWSVKLTLNFILPLVRGVAGIWTFETAGAASTIPQLRNIFDEVLMKRGEVKGIIFDLNVKYAQSQKPKDKSRYPVVSLVPNESEENQRLIIEAKKPIKLLQN